VRLLEENYPLSIDVSQHNIADKLGQLFSLSDSMYLSETLDGQISQASAPAKQQAEDIKELFFNARKRMVEFILKSFVADSDNGSFALPSNVDITDLTATTELYQKFYALHQSEMESRANQLRVKVRKVLAEASPELAQLTALDKALGNVLSSLGRKGFASIPQLLSSRLQTIQSSLLEPSTDNSRQTSIEMANIIDDWQKHFHSEIQDLLIAELEVRLQPTLGLIEALNAKVNNHHD
jgi:hypothetical protein